MAIIYTDYIINITYMIDRIGIDIGHRFDTRCKCKLYTRIYGEDFIHF